jgi:thioredoxin reductase (NADPH)
MEFAGMGVSYCATCDGAFFRKKTVAVVGGGDVAVEDAIFLAGLCQKVYLIHRRDKLRAAVSLQGKLFSMENVEIIWDSQVAEICGNELVESIKIVNKKTGENTELEINGIFIAVGITPNTELVKNLVEVDENGYIVADETCETTQKGIFAAGDIRRKPMRQIITAVADGANAVNSVQKFLNC